MGGVLTLPQPVNGKEYQRILSTLEYEGDNYFYGFVEIPMTEDEIYVQHEDKNLNRITENEISKVILFLSCAEGIETPGVFSEDGTVTNMEEIRESLSVNVSEKEEKIQEKQKQTEEILSEILEGLPKDSGEKSTVDYFLKWLDGNMTYTDSLSEVGEPVPNMGKMLDAYYERNHLAAVIEKKGNCPGICQNTGRALQSGRHGSPCGCRNLEGRLGTGRQLCVLCRFHEWADHLCRCSRGKGRLSWGRALSDRTGSLCSYKSSRLFFI